jgi:hypothetical protein
VLTWRSGGETAFDSVHYAGREEGSLKLFLMKDVNFVGEFSDERLYKT